MKQEKPVSLEESRKAIDEIDAELVRLFARRMECSRTVADYKRAHHMEVLNAAREEQVLKSRAALAGDPALTASVTELFREIMRLSREEQYRYLDSGLHGKAVAYSGIPGAFSESAVIQSFGENSDRVSCRSFDEVFTAVASDQAAYGVLPVENSSSGSINDVYDLLNRYACHIVGEQLVAVEHCLLALPGASLGSIRTVYSHDQGFLQCAAFLSKHPEWQKVPYFNTAIAARHVAELGDPGCAAIASRLAAKEYGLSILCPSIQDYAGNYTRFIIVGSSPRSIGTPDKATLTFSLRHERGTLHRALSAFVALGLNLTHIESRPLHDTPWEYRFYVDVTGNVGRENLSVLLNALQADCVSCRLLGAYQAAKR